MASKKQRYAHIFRMAHQVGRLAGDRAKPTPMVVQAHANPLDDDSPVTQQWFVGEGACGFAWVVVRPATTGFARWLKKMGYAHKHYYGGYAIWIGDHGQSYERKMAHARAMAKYLSNYADELGNTFQASGRLD